MKMIQTLFYYLLKDNMKVISIMFYVLADIE